MYLVAEVTVPFPSVTIFSIRARVKIRISKLPFKGKSWRDKVVIQLGVFTAISVSFFLPTAGRCKVENHEKRVLENLTLR